MEKQTIGQFLSALRRSNGYTQQDVAEKMGVSNKTVSCWERDTSCPDISLIPALAELYGVTCDEILRAKRSPAKADSETSANGEADEAKAKANAERAEREASAVFNNMIARYDNTHKITVASTVFATVIAVIIASVLSFTVEQAYWSFLITSIVAGVCIFILFLAQFRLDFALPSDERTLKVRSKIFRRRKTATGFILLCAVYFLPYTQNLPFDTDVIAFGLAAVIATFLLLTGARLAKPLSKPEFYKKVNPVLAKKRFISYVVIMSVATVAFAAFWIIKVNTPYSKDHTSGGNATCATIEQVKQLASENTLPDKYRQAPVFPSVTDQQAEYIYYVDRSDFDENDLAGITNYTVVGGIADKTYTVYVLYPVWHVNYEYTDEATGETLSAHDSFIMFNRKYQTSFLQQREDGTFILRAFNTYDKISMSQAKRHDDIASILRFGLADAAAALFVFATVCSLISVNDKKKAS